MNERVKFVAAMLEAEESFGELRERFGISRKQGYKWRERYQAGGVQALVDRSRAPHSHPHAVSPDVMQLLVAARKKHPRLGAEEAASHREAAAPARGVASGERGRSNPEEAGTDWPSATSTTQRYKPGTQVTHQTGGNIGDRPGGGDATHGRGAATPGGGTRH